MIALGYAVAPLAAVAHVEAPADCCGPSDAAAFHCDDDCDAPGHHHHHDAAKCGTCGHSGVAAAPTVRLTHETPRPIAAEIRAAETVRTAFDVQLPSSRAPPDATR